MDNQLKLQLRKAVKLAQAGDWDASHHIHAVLHKIEGDEGNSRYWYARCNKRFENHVQASQELDAIEHFLI